MKSRPLLAIPIVIILSLASSALAGRIDIVLTPLATPGESNAGVVIDVTITDTGGAPTCTNIGIRRRAVYYCGGLNSWQLAGCIARQSGTVRLFDTVSANTSYVYEAIGYTGASGACGPPSDPAEFLAAFDYTGWGFPILAYTSVGPDPTPIGHGRLLTNPDATPNFYLESCAISCPGIASGIGPPEVIQYVGTGIEVLVYGTVSYCCNCCGYLIYATSAVPMPCAPVGVEERPWSTLKRLYRS
jgi:hypothetical protein